MGIGAGTIPPTHGVTHSVPGDARKTAFTTDKKTQLIFYYFKAPFKRFQTDDTDDTDDPPPGKGGGNPEDAPRLIAIIQSMTVRSR